MYKNGDRCTTVAPHNTSLEDARAAIFVFYIYYKADVMH
jgi:hypothetical protein